jgi:hypothetical protein
MTNKNIAIRIRNPGRKSTIGGKQLSCHALSDAIVNISEGAVQAVQPGPSF